MSFRFRKSVKLMPGVRLNLSKRGGSLSLGPRGASVTVGRQGVYGNVGLPGSGVSYRTRLDTARTRASGAAASSAMPQSAHVRVELEDDGKVILRDDAGAELSPRAAKAFRDGHAELLQQWLEQQCNHWNAGIEAILNLHLQTPSRASGSRFEPISFAEERTPPFEPIPVPWWTMLMPWRRADIERQNEEKALLNRKAEEAWQARRREHMESEEHRRKLYESAASGDVQAMQAAFEDVLQRIDWPRETSVSFELDDHGSTLWLDVDLPEIEDLPSQTASVASRGLRISVKEKSDTQRRKEYMVHIHAIVFLLIGYAFARLSTLQQAVVSGYSQRTSKMTGVTSDEYLLSVTVRRDQWEGLNLENLQAIDPVTSLEQFELRRTMTKTGVFTPIEPFAKV